ncbi:aldose 1-epimerase [Noviherbaspirillum massiliense]|uniref:aldose 1-epimerase n=1 Tax=Noviherbaspirillum massiliense TaxID=1465823 RepID=UPI000314C1EB|nr:aldose 1-epimerase [Noviherbaspirillum massiliense]
MNTDTVSLQTGFQRLILVPRLGGGIAAWDWKIGDGWSPIFRTWNGASEDRYTLACFPLVPWSNRITQGGFEHEGLFYPIRNNRPGEPYPIHGDGWLQPWEVLDQTDNSITLALESHRFDDNPYHYASTETLRLHPDGLAIDLTVTNRGNRALPYGLGLHPYFMRNEQTRLQSTASGVWLSGDDPIPAAYTRDFPPTWDYNKPAPLEGPLIDNCFDGWNGASVIDYPDRNMTVTMSMANCSGYSLLYRPPGLPFFCLEPITHPIDALHMPGQPGLVVLKPGESFTLKARFFVELRRPAHEVQ